MLEEGAQFKMIKRTGKVIAIFLLLMMTVLPASCSMVEDSSLMKGNPKKISVEKGWTVKDDGSYTFAFVIENTSDKVLTNCEINVYAYDAEGNKIEPKEDNYINTVGPLWPGEKTVIGEELETTKDPEYRMWNETPASFDYTLHASWDSECEEPHLVLEGAEPTDGEFSEDCYYYDLRVRNAGTEDYDWAQARIDNETLFTPVPNFYAVARDADGNITGMEWMPEDDDSKTPSVIPAGETVTVKVVTNTDYGDNIEFMLEW